MEYNMLDDPAIVLEKINGIASLNKEIIDRIESMKSRLVISGRDYKLSIKDFQIDVTETTSTALVEDVIKAFVDGERTFKDSEEEKARRVAALTPINYSLTSLASLVRLNEQIPTIASVVSKLTSESNTQIAMRDYLENMEWLSVCLGEIDTALLQSASALETLKAKAKRINAELAELALDAHELTIPAIHRRPIPQDVLYKENLVSLPDDEAAKRIIDSIIVVFFADGSPKYTDMTLYAIQTFLEKTPRISVGLLTVDMETRTSVINALPEKERHRIVPRLVSSTPHLPGWNPTQYKLDVAQYAESYSTLFWFDSDTITIGDMTYILAGFALDNNHSFFMVADHVNSDHAFQRNWAANIGYQPCIPQACLMGFKSSVVLPFFEMWKTCWKLWIYPNVFTTFPDPNPDFEGSAFCTEQYALGQALAFHEAWIRGVLWFKRIFVGVPVSGGRPLDYDAYGTSIQDTYTGEVRHQKIHNRSMISTWQARSTRLPAKTITLYSAGQRVETEVDYIDRFHNVYHCYNHTYARVKAWYLKHLSEQQKEL